MAALWAVSSLPLHSPGKGANKPHPECIASDLPQAGCERPFCPDTIFRRNTVKIVSEAQVGVVGQPQDGRRVEESDCDLFGGANAP